MNRQEEMFQLIEQYRVSGLSAKSFARENNISASTMGYWIRKKRSLEKGSGFVEISGSTSGAMEVELLFPNGVQLRMNGGDPALIATLVQLRHV
ncbi:IS66 family insertion sequence element accessory protein TnpA [Autumnicola musiva]|uniref:IS66 family insertion sequence element accessory protein TnpB n=1 Tax=Autumnicola musiva TaxID=3075589 RepID=A0ABU3DBE2_9FLAO|nr:IS66 family insertion sequence element accessory protein TnpB [Zunongwangia sp. F117]MDT0678851.1 IS66 family insertion sequence element accessory protein TnpB [Zunongwangia sp. F117]